VTFNAGDVVVVPFPFTDRTSNKRRPALVLSSGLQFNAPSLVRMKLFTLDQRLIVRKAGILAKNDQSSVAASLNILLRAGTA